MAGTAVPIKHDRLAGIGSIRVLLSNHSRVHYEIQCEVFSRIKAKCAVCLKSLLEGLTWKFNVSLGTPSHGSGAYDTSIVDLRINTS